MKLIKLSAISLAVLASTAALAAEPVAYQYNNDAGVIRNTTGAVVGGTKTAFSKVVNPASVSAEIGSLGYGANIAWSLNENTELQAGWAGGDAAELFGGDFDVKDVNYDFDTDFSNPYLGVQLRPAGNWFTVGAGIIVPDNEITAKANAEGAGVGSYYRVDGNKYFVNDPRSDVSIDLKNADEINVGSVTADLEHRNKLAPYLTVGFRPNITNNFGLFGEIGAAYMGKTTATVTASGFNGDAAIGKIKEELENENWLEWLPIVKLGATYRF
jgi:hypothetical protein